MGDQRDRVAEKAFPYRDRRYGRRRHVRHEAGCDADAAALFAAGIMRGMPRQAISLIPGMAIGLIEQAERLVNDIDCAAVIVPAVGLGNGRRC